MRLLTILFVILLNSSVTTLFAEESQSPPLTEEVVVMDKCDLVITYKIRTSMTNVDVYVSKEPFFGKIPLQTIKLYQDTSEIDAVGPFSEVGFECYSGTKPKMLNGWFNSEFLLKAKPTEIALTKDQFCNSTGMGGNSCNHIKQFQAFNIVDGELFIWSTEDLTYALGIKKPFRGRTEIQWKSDFYSINPKKASINLADPAHEWQRW